MRLRNTLACLAVGFGGIGCGAPGLGDESGALGDIAVLQGTISDWKYPAGLTLSAALNSDKTLTSALIDALGSFSIELPRGTVLGPDLLQHVSGPRSSLCSSVPSAEPAEYKSGSLSLWVPRPVVPLLSISLTSIKPGLFAFPSSGDREVDFLYVDRDVRITGELRCDIAGVLTIAHLDYYLRTGWNTVITEYKEVYESSSPMHLRIVTANYTKAAPSDLTWRKSE